LVHSTQFEQRPSLGSLDKCVLYNRLGGGVSILHLTGVFLGGWSTSHLCLGANSLVKGHTAALVE